MKTLDRTRPFGIISPPHEGAQFEQDGVFFDHAGLPVGAEADDVEQAEPEEPAESEGEQEDAPEVEAEPSPIAPAGEDPGIDWDDNFFKVRSVLKDHGFEGSKKDEAVAFCKSKGWAVPE